MVVNGKVQRLCKEYELRYVDLWDSFVGKQYIYGRNGLHLICRGTLKRGCQWFGKSKVSLSKKVRNVQDDSRCKEIQGNTSKADLECVCLNVRSTQTM